MRLAAAVVLLAALSLAFTAVGAVSAEPARAAPPLVIPTVSAGVLSASASPTSTSSGSSVVPTLIFSDYLGAAACGGGTLDWQMAGTSNSIVYDTGVGNNGTFPYSWTAQSGEWTFSGEFIPNDGGTNCTTATSNPVVVTVTGGSGGLSLTGWLYQFASITYHAIISALDDGIAAPIASIMVTIGSAFAMLEAPWGSALAALGPMGPAALVFGLLATAAACYGILGLAGVARDALGD